MSDYAFDTTFGASETTTWASLFRRRDLFYHSFACAVLILLPFVLNYGIFYTMYHWSHTKNNRRQPTQKTFAPRLPPRLPYAIPLLGNSLGLLFGGQRFMRAATRYGNTLCPVRITLPGAEVYLLSGHETLSAFWRQKWLSSPIWAYTKGLKYIFAMREESIETYAADDSGVFSKPHPDTCVEPHNRVDFLTHDGLLKAFARDGLPPLVHRFQAQLCKRLAAHNFGTEWIEVPDMRTFFEETIGDSIIEAIFGPTLLSIDGFREDLWKFDKGVPYLAKQFPRFLAPRAHGVRDRMLTHLQRWYLLARTGFSKEVIADDGDADPFWGSELLRSRQQYLLAADKQDDAAVSSVDLGLLWTSITNVVPAALLAVWHVFEQPGLRHRLRNSLRPCIKTETPLLLDIEKLLQCPLLSSIYAETLRLHVFVFVTRRSVHQDFRIGEWRVPHNEIAMVNSYAAHMDDEFWNTKDGKHPLTTFWPERFIVDPSDPTTGPRKHEFTLRASEPAESLDDKSQAPFFSMRGLEGSWIPYGGGYGACPGRHLAKREMLLIMAMFALEFDIEFLGPVQMDSSGFGIATQKPKGRVKFRIRRRTRCSEGRADSPRG